MLDRIFLKTAATLVTSWLALALFTSSAALAETRSWTLADVGQGDFRTEPDASRVYKTVPAVDGNEAELDLRLFFPPGYDASTDRRPAIILFHGGGWQGGNPDQFYAQCRYLALRGMVAASVRYRCMKEFKTSVRECVIDARSAVRWVRQHAVELGIDPQKIAVGGGSAGGHLAAATALVEGLEQQGEDSAISCRPDALVLFNPVYDNGPGGFGHSLVRDYWQQISPIDNIDAETPPTIVFLGSEDKLLPVATAERFDRLMEEQDVRCDTHVYQGRPHGFFNNWKAENDFMDTLLKTDRFLASLGFLEGEPQLELDGPELDTAHQPSSSVAAPSGAPNIVYILADDLGYGDLSHAGGLAPTPHCDRLAAEGMRFTDAHTSSSVCTPTRYGILTGRYNWRSRQKAGVLSGFSPPLIDEARVTVGDFLQQHGYHTGMVGKWHLGIGWQKLPVAEQSDQAVDEAPEQAKWQQKGWDFDYTKPAVTPVHAGFHAFFGIAASLDMPPYVYIRGDRAIAVPTVEKKFLRKGAAAEDFEAVDCLRDFAAESRAYIAQRGQTPQTPFFLYLPLTSPHTPIVPAPRWQGKSGIGDYGDFLMETDWVVGEVLAELEAQGIDANTMIIFTADNGCSPQAKIADLVSKGHKPNGDWRGHKADIFEGGHRVPFLVRWPAKVAAGTVSDSTICTTDLFATAADAIGAADEVADSMAEDSFSFLPDLLGTGRTARATTVHHSINGSFAIREGKWKLILCPGSGGWSKPAPGKDKELLAEFPRVQLYDLQADPAEQTNLEAAHPEVVDRLVKQLAGEIKQGRSTPGAPQSNEGKIPFKQDLLALFPELRQE